MSGEVSTVAWEIVRLKERQAEIGKRQAALQNELTTMNGRVRGRTLPAAEYKHICARQKKVKQEISALQEQAGVLKSEIRRWAALEEEFRHEARRQGPRDNMPSMDPSVLSELRIMRDHYLNFSEDGTRISSMRLMASEFASKLTKLLAGQ